MTAVLELRQVSMVYGSGPSEVHALRGIDLAVDGGELVAVMGPSGSGKSTLLTIAGAWRNRPAARCWSADPRCRG
jgi:putative ABC transport system ATP-binding protein